MLQFEKLSHENFFDGVLFKTKQHFVLNSPTQGLNLLDRKFSSPTASGSSQTSIDLMCQVDQFETKNEIKVSHENMYIQSGVYPSLLKF